MPCVLVTQRRRSFLRVLALLAVAGSIIGSVWPRRSCARAESGAAVDSPAPRKFAPLVPPSFGSAPADPFAVPELAFVPLPRLTGEAMVSSGLAADSSGRIWFGLSPDRASGARDPARLFQFVPDVGRLTARGDAIGQLFRSGLPRQTQRVLAPAILTAADGALYFLTHDGETPAASSPPKAAAGSHLWRLEPSSDRWELLANCSFVLDSLAGGGNSLIAFGAKEQALLRYDLTKRRGETIKLPKGKGTWLECLYCDARGHVFLLRANGNSETVALVELNSEFRAIGNTTLDQARSRNPRSAACVPCVQPMKGGSFILLTQSGFLYRVVPKRAEPAAVEQLGWFHPDGEAFAEALLTLGGERYLAGMARPASSPAGSPERHTWVVYDLRSKKSAGKPLDQELATAFETLNEANDRPPSEPRRPLALRVRGLGVHDRLGNVYLDGLYGSIPFLLQVRTTPGSFQLPSPTEVQALVSVSQVNPLTISSSKQAQKRTDFDRVTANRSERPKDPNPRGHVLPTEKEKRHPGLESSPRMSSSSTKTTESTPSVSREDRLRFHKEIEQHLQAKDGDAGKAILDLAVHSRTQRTPQLQSLMARAAARVDRRARVSLLRTHDVPEPIILDDLIAAEVKTIGSRRGPRNTREAILRAARFLLSVPVD